MNTDPDQDKEFPPLTSETIPEGVVLTLRTAMKLKTFSVDADTNINFGGKQYKAADVLAIIRKEDGEEDVTSINTRRTKHCFMRVLGLIVSDKHRSDFFPIPLVVLKARTG